MRRGWTQTTLGAFLPLAYGKGLVRKERVPGAVPVFGSSGVVGTHTEALTNGPTLIVGRKGNVGAVHLSPQPCWPIDTVYFHEAPSGTDLRFGFYLLEHKSLRRFDKSTAVPGLSRDDYDCIEVDLPPALEQRRIAEAIESHLSRLDVVVLSLEGALAKLDAYRASVFKAAVEGRLVPTEAEIARVEKYDYEPADVLLKRILTERRRCWEENELSKREAAGKLSKDDKWKAKYPDPAAPDKGGLPELPEGWCWASVGQMSWSVRDGPHYSPPYVEHGVPFVTGGQVRPWGVDFDGAKRISEDIHRKLCERVSPEIGDLLYTKGGTTGIARVNTYAQAFSVWVHVAVLKLARSINPFYLQHALNSPSCFAQAQRFTHGVGNQDLGLTRMVKIVFSLPPRAEQDRIVDEVDRLESVVRETRHMLEVQIQRVRRLRQSILKWAFEGRLVDQDSNDQLAEEVLDGIRAKDATSNPETSRRRHRSKAVS